MSPKNYLPWLIIFLFPFGCARQTSPTGGPKDTIPPILIKENSIPKNGTKNFKGQTVTLQFNEWIILNNPKEQLIITPDVNKKYDITARKTKVTLKFEQKLLDTTTYAIHFRGAVQDITEKNPAVNLKLAFSTGPFIDSLQIRGHVLNPLTTLEPKNITVAVYTPDTFDIFKHKPVYITQSDEKGKFSIENLKPGKYYIYAIDDRNRNLIADSKSEMYGFIPESITLNANASDITIPIQKLDARELKLTGARPYNTYFNIKTSKSLTSYEVTTTNGLPPAAGFGEDRSSIRIYNTLNIQDSLQIKFTASDSTQNKLDTTFYIKFSTRKVEPEPFNMKQGTFSVLAHRGTIHGDIQFNKPLAHINFDSIYYVIDSLNVIRFDSSNIIWDPFRLQLKLHQTYDKKLTEPPTDPKSVKKGRGNNQLHFGKGAFVSVENDSTTHQTPMTLNPIHFEDTGVLIVKITTSKPNFLVQLLDKDFKVIRSIANKKQVTFEDLPPSDYQVRVVHDTNGDNAWTPANFHMKRPTEQTVYYKTTKGANIIKLKANFEIELLITL